MMHLLFLDLAQIPLGVMLLILPNLSPTVEDKDNFNLVLRLLTYLVAVYKISCGVDFIKERLFIAIERNNYLEVKQLLDWGVDVNLKGMVFFTLEVVRRLSHPLASTSVPLPLSYAVNQVGERNELVKLLLERGAEVNFPGKYSPLWFSSKRGHAATVELLLEHGADFNHSVNGVTPLMIASAEGHDAAISVILEHVMDGYRL